MRIVIAANRSPRKVRIMNEQINTMNGRETLNLQANLIAPEPCDPHESTYALLIRSEEKSRSAFEMATYPLLLLGPLIAIWQFAQQPVNIPAAGLKGERRVVCGAWAQNNGGEEFHSLCGGPHTEIKG
jgi:hypothetical protein